VGREAGAGLVCGTSLKAALDRDWDQVGQREEALEAVLQVLQAVESWVQTLPPDEAALAGPSLEIARQVKAQDVQVDVDGKASLIKGVAKDRRISVEDSQMRHGRKSRSVRVNGYKRHVLHDLDTGLIRAVGVTPANVPEASVTEAISADLERQGQADLYPGLGAADHSVSGCAGNAFCARWGGPLSQGDLCGMSLEGAMPTGCATR